MGMKDPKNEPQSQLASNLVSSPKDSAGGDYSNLVSMAKDDQGGLSNSNLVSHKGGVSTTEKPG